MKNANTHSPGKLPDGMDSLRSLYGSTFPKFSTGPEIAEPPRVLNISFEKLRKCWIISVEGCDSSLPADDIDKALKDHFGPCGAIVKVELPGVVYSHASVIILGDDANVKALELNGSEMGRQKLTVTVQPWPEVKIWDVPFGAL